MGSTKQAVSLELFPYLRVYTDGTLERTAGTEVVPAGLDPETSVLSKDIIIIPETGVSARLYRPNTISSNQDQKLPLAVYFHGGAFFISSPADPKYHHSLNKLVSEANIIAVSVDYRIAPEHPLPAAYEDSWAAIQWVASQVTGDGIEPWLKNHVDFEKVYLMGDSAGANIAHHLALRVKNSYPGLKMKLQGIVMVHPYFWGENPIGVEMKDPVRKSMVDNWWSFVCPSEKGNEDPLINPFVDGAPSLGGLECERVQVIVAEKDILRDRGRQYYEELGKSGWGGKAEIVETEGEDHVFHIFAPNCEKAMGLIKSIASFINQREAIE